MIKCADMPIEVYRKTWLKRSATVGRFCFIKK